MILMLASRRFLATFLMVGILAGACCTVFQVYDAHGHGWNPIQYTSTSTSVTTLSIDDQVTVSPTFSPINRDQERRLSSCQFVVLYLTSL